MIRTIAAALMAATALTGAGLAQDAGAEPERSILNVAGDVYRFQNNAHFGVFMVTDEGIAVVDPINTGASEWLKAELEERFDVPVKFVAYSHHHWDHASGGAVFEDTAAFVGHEAMSRSLVPLQDPNSDGDAYSEQYDEVRTPTVTYTDSGAIELGGKTMELIHAGGAHAPDMTFAYFPEEQVLFAVDVISTKRLPFRNMPGFDLADTEAIIDAALVTDFETIVPGHGDIGGRADVEEYRQYHHDLLEGVQAGIDAGQSLEDIQENLMLEEYAEWGAYEDWRTLNIEGAYTYLTATE